MPKFIFTESPAESGSITVADNERVMLCITDSPEVAGAKMQAGHDTVMAVPLMDALVLFTAFIKLQACRANPQEAIKGGHFAKALEDLEEAVKEVIV